MIRRPEEILQDLSKSRQAVADRALKSIEEALERVGKEGEP